MPLVLQKTMFWYGYRRAKRIEDGWAFLNSCGGRMMKGKRLEMFIPVLFLAICLHVSGTRTTACECQTVTENVTYPKGWFLAYDPENPDTIARDSDETINIFGCRPPFTWSVSGNGFDLDWYETGGLFNILTADVTACGAAEITVTDNYGESVAGYVRSTTGQWLECYDSGRLSYCGGPTAQDSLYEEGHWIWGLFCHPSWDGSPGVQCGTCDDAWSGCWDDDAFTVGVTGVTWGEPHWMWLRLYKWECP